MKTNSSTCSKLEQIYKNGIEKLDKSYDMSHNKKKKRNINKTHKCEYANCTTIFAMTTGTQKFCPIHKEIAKKEHYKKYVKNTGSHRIGRPIGSKNEKTTNGFLYSSLLKNLKENL